MRVLSIIDSLAVGGAESSLVAAAPALTDRGIELHVATLAGGGLLAADMRTTGASLTDGVGASNRAATVVSLRRHIAAVAPDIVHTTLFEADIAGRLATVGIRVPVVSSLVTEAYGPEHLDNPDFVRFKVRLAQLADIATARRVTRFHAVSEATKHAMSRRLLIPLDRIEVIPRGRDPRALGARTTDRRNEARAALGASGDDVVMLAAGRHYHYKGLDRLVAAMGRIRQVVPTARLFIAGRKGPATNDLERIIGESKLAGSVHLLGHRPDLGDLMCAADVFCLPSRAEGSPGVLLEAMALGVPVVASDIGSVREMAPGGEVLMVTGDGEPWAAAIRSVLEDKRSTEDRVERARRRFADRYTIGAVADDTVRFYESVL